MTAVTAASGAREAVGPAAPAQRARLVGLDGIRGLAALFVVLHHCYLMSFPGYPANTGPVWLAWLLYGHFAVVVFIALSGFSLAVAPARRDWQLGGLARFGHRRVWRILPPYWAALAFSLLMAWTVAAQPGAGTPTGKSVAVYGLLLQDIFGSPTPNGAFWSIAIEAQLYLVFPVMLLILRRAGAPVLLGLVCLIVTAIGVLAPVVSIVDKLNRLTPQFAALFAMGLVAAGVISASERVRRLPWQWFAAAAAAPVLVVLVLHSSTWWDANHYWVDFAAGPAVALLLAAVATRRPTPLVWLLDTRPVRSLGTFSYSLYLVHAPIVVAINQKLVAPHVAPGLPTLWVTLALAVPVSVLSARLFAAVFEIPFQRYRSWTALRAAIRARLARLRRAAQPAETPVGAPALAEATATVSEP